MVRLDVHKPNFSVALEALSTGRIFTANWPAVFLNVTRGALVRVVNHFRILH
jgi:hypothetical protein